MPNYPTGKIHHGYGGILRRERKSGMDVIRTFIYPTQKANFVPRMANYLSFVLSSSILGSIVLRRADFLLIESPPLFLGLSGAWLSMLKHARLIFNVSDLWPESAVRLGLVQHKSLSLRLSQLLERFCYRRAWLVTGQSKTILTNIKERFPDCSTFHLSNGVDTGVFTVDRSNDTARTILNGSGRGRLVALYAGLHGLAQGLDQVLNAAEVLRAQSTLEFVLVGDGPEKKTLLEHAKKRRLDNVRFLDARPARDIPSLIAAADIVIVPLKTYIPGAVPSKLYEAMASSRPVVLVADGEAAEIVREHQAGLVVKPGDVSGLVQALLSLCSQSSLRETLGLNGRRAVELSFDRAQIAARFIKHLEKSL